MGTVQLWCNAYKRHGVAGISKVSRSYTAQFKESAVKYMRKNHLSFREAAAILNIPFWATLQRWEKLYTHYKH